MESTCLYPTREAGRDFILRKIEGPIVMLNLLRFRETADYSATPVLNPAKPISGREAYDIYVRLTLPFLKESGGDILFLGKGGHFLIGPENEYWDATITLVDDNELLRRYELALETDNPSINYTLDLSD